MTRIPFDPARPRFPDVNYGHPVRDWAALLGALSGGTVLGMKVNEGTHVDPAFPGHLYNAEAQGLLVIGYCFGIGSVDGKTQADRFLELFPPRAGRLPCLDFERDKNHPMMSVAQAEQWVSEVQLAYGRWPLFYSHSDWINAGQPEGTLIAQCPYWGPTYGPELDVPRGVGQPIAHQYTDGVFGPPPHSFPGVGACDINELLVPVSTLIRMAGAAASDENAVLLVL